MKTFGTPGISGSIHKPINPPIPTPVHMLRMLDHLVPLLRSFFCRSSKCGQKKEKLFSCPSHLSVTVLNASPFLHDSLLQICL